MPTSTLSSSFLSVRTPRAHPQTEAICQILFSDESGSSHSTFALLLISVALRFKAQFLLRSVGTCFVIAIRPNSHRAGSRQAHPTCRLCLQFAVVIRGSDCSRDLGAQRLPWQQNSEDKAVLSFNPSRTCHRPNQQPRAKQVLMLSSVCPWNARHRCAVKHLTELAPTRLSCC